MAPESPGASGNGNGKQKMFVPREALMSRANSLKKALKQIIEHAEQGKYKTRACLGINMIMCFLQQQDACYTGITRDAGADSFIPTVCFAD